MITGSLSDGLNVSELHQDVIERLRTELFDRQTALNRQWYELQDQMNELNRQAEILGGDIMELDAELMRIGAFDEEE